MSVVEVTEFTDPGCVWSWGSEPQLRWLREHYGPQLRWRRVLGIQIDDVAETHPDRDPVADAERFRGDWLAVAEHTAAPVPLRLAWMHRSSRPAVWAVAAAEQQGAAVADAVLRRLREAVFVLGRPGDTPERIAAAVRGVEGLDVDALLAGLDDPAVREAVQAGWAETRNPHPAVIGRTGPGPHVGAARPDGERLRYGFPTLILRGPGGEEVVAGWRTTDELRAAVLAAGAEPVSEPPLDPAEALERHRTLTVRDVELLTDGVAAAGAVRIATATTELLAHPAEAERLGAAAHLTTAG